jgi:hypothetical protein
MWGNAEREEKQCNTLTRFAVRPNTAGCKRGPTLSYGAPATWILGAITLPEEKNGPMLS